MSHFLTKVPLGYFVFTQHWVLVTSYASGNDRCSKSIPWMHEQRYEKRRKKSKEKQLIICWPCSGSLSTVDRPVIVPGGNKFYIKLQTIQLQWLKQIWYYCLPQLEFQVEFISGWFDYWHVTKVLGFSVFLLLQMGQYDNLDKMIVTEFSTGVWADLLHE